MPLELIAGAVVGAAAASPSVRKVVRRGMVYGLAGALIAYDRVASLTTKMVQGARKSVAEAEAHTPAQHPTPTTSETAAPESVVSRATVVASTN